MCDTRCESHFTQSVSIGWNLVSQARRDAVCQALLDAVVDVQPSTVELVLARDHARLVEGDGGWTTEHDLEPFHTCRLPNADQAA